MAKPGRATTSKLHYNWFNSRDPQIFRSACSLHIRCGFSWQIHFTKTIFRFIAKPGCSTMSKLLHKWVLWSNFDVLLHPGFAINQKMILVKCILRQKNYLMLRLQADLWLWPKIWGALTYIYLYYNATDVTLPTLRYRCLSKSWSYCLMNQNISTLQ